MAGVILDSSVLIAFERGRLDFDRLSNDFRQLAIAAITAAELLIGAERSDDAHRVARRKFVEDILAVVPIHPFELAHARVLAIHTADLCNRGMLIGDRDLQIATTALVANFSLATLNVREFGRVSGLNLIDLTPYVVS